MSLRLGLLLLCSGTCKCVKIVAGDAFADKGGKEDRGRSSERSRRRCGVEVGLVSCGVLD